MPYGQDNDGGGIERLIAFIAALGQLRGGAIESQINTQEPISIRTRVGLPLGNAGAFALGFCLVPAGLFLMSLSIEHLFDLDWDPRSWLLAWVLLVAAAYGLAVAIKWGFKASERISRQVRVVQAFAAVGVVLVLGMAVGSLLLTVHERFGLELAGLVVGPALAMGGAALAYNQGMDLVNPYWRRSPFESDIAEEFFPILRDLLQIGRGQQQEQVRTEDPRYLQRKAQYGVIARSVVLNGAPESEDEPLVDDQLVQIDAEAGNLIWFVRFAARMPSLSARDLTIRPAPLLPFQEDGRDKRLRRDMIRRLIVRGSTEDEQAVDGKTERGLGAGGFWTLRGQGATPEWVMPPDEAKRRAQQMWDSVYDGELPVPDYWDELNETRRAA